MFSSCDLTAEFDLQEISCDSNNLYPELSNNSTYYEENPIYSEVSEPHIEHCKSTKTKHTSSPVEIHQESTLNIDLPPISWHSYDSIPKILNVINTGRTILINGQWTKNRPYITGGPLNGNYMFSQIHFHSPSEHEINGKRCPLEMHAVHYKTSYLTQERAMEERDGTVVIVYLFQVLNTQESVLSTITNSVHLIEKVNDRIELTGIALNQILQPVVSNYYIYWGSVSTAKNSYLLQWIISCNNLCVTNNEVDKLVRILCSNESFVDNQASQMNIVNDVIYHVEEEDYDLSPKINCSSYSDVSPKCYCRYHCQKCQICTVHKDLHSKSAESRPCPSKKKEKKNLKPAAEDNFSSVTSNSQSSTCEDEKKNKNENVVLEPLSCSNVDKNSKDCDRRGQKHINFTKPSSSSLKSNSKMNFCVESKNLDENKQDTKGKKVKKNETGNASRNTSKTSVKNCPQNKKSKTKNILEENICKDLNVNSNTKKEKQKSKQKKLSKKELRNSKQKKTNDCSESSEVNLKNCEDDQQSDKNAENCDLQVDIQCMPVLVSIDKTEGLLELKNDSVEEKKERKVEKSKKETEESVVCEKLLQPLKDIIEEKTSMHSESDDIKTIFEKKRSFSSSVPNSNDCTVSFLLAPNSLQTKYSPLTSEPECIEIAKSIPSNPNTSVENSMNKTQTFRFSSIKSPEQSKDICFQMEHLFHAERKGDFSNLVTQEYNVAVICNHNILQEFRGIFRPNELELGTYEKLHLVPKYPEPENINIRLDGCFVKMETLDQLCIRAKFLLNKVDINGTSSDTECKFEEQVKIPDLKLSDVRNCQLDCAEEENLQRCNETVPQIIPNESVLKNKVLENEECKVELVKKPDSDSKQSSKNIKFDSLQQSSKLQNEERRENNLTEITDKSIKDLFHKRKKKVYFTYEKIEKDENSGREVFVGSFRTKKELKALSKEKKLCQEIDASFLAEDSTESDKEKNLFLSSSEGSFEESVKAKNPTELQENKFQAPAKCSESNKPDESKNLITLHKHKPKNSQVNYNRDECESIKFQNREIVIQSEEQNKSNKCNDPSLAHSQRLSPNKSQTALIVLPVGKENLSKVGVTSTEHLKNDKKNAEMKEKEYIPCLNCYH